MYQQLTRLDHDQQVLPDLATAWRMVDETTWEFDLREGVKFHNGEPFNAEAVKYTYEVVFDPQYGFIVTAAWPDKTVEVEVVDDYTVRLHTTGPFGEVPFFVQQIPILPPVYTEEVGLEGHHDNPVGTGPFKFVEFVPGDYLKLEAYDDYWKGRVKLDGVLWRYILEPSTRLAGLVAGELDIVREMSQFEIPTIENSGIAHMDYGDESLELVVYLDTFTGGPLDDILVRQAVQYGIDKKTIIEKLVEPLGKLNDQMLTPGVFGYNTDLDPIPYDPDQAAALLDEAGWVMGEGQYREKDGESLSLQFSTYAGGKYFGDVVGMAVAEQLGKIGIEVYVVPGVGMVRLDYLMNPTKRVDMIYVSMYNAGSPIQGMQWFSMDHPNCRWESQEYIELFRQAKVETDDAKREAMYFELAEMVREGASTVFMFQVTVGYGVSDKVEGFSPHPIQKFYLDEVDLLN